MNLGTIAFNKEVFNLDLMNSEELELLLEHIEKEKNKVKKEFRKTTNKMFELDTKIDKLEDLADTNYSHSNKFLRNL